MKNRRAILWLLAALIATSAIHLVLHFKGGMNRALVQRTHLLDSAMTRVVRLKIERAEAPDTLLVRTQRWRLVEPYGAAADEGQVLKVLDTLSMAEVESAIGDQELLRLGRTREDFGLSQPRVRLTVSTAARSTEISFGAVTPAGDGCYASVSGESVVYVVPLQAFEAVNVPPEDYRRRTIFSVGPEAATALDIKRGKGSFMRFERQGELWRMIQPREASASAERVKTLLEGVMTVSATRFIWPTGAAGEAPAVTTALLAGYGLDPETAVTVTVKCTDGFDRQISFGNEATDGLVYALVQNSSTIITVPGSVKDVALTDISAFTDTRLFPMEEAAISRVSVTDGEAAYLLARDEAGAWFLESPVAAATDAASMSAFLSRLRALHLDDVVSNGVTVAVTPGDKSVVVSRESALGAFRLESLRSREIIRVDAAEVRRLVVTNVRETTPTAVVYDADRRAWNVESSATSGLVSTEALASVLDLLAPLRAETIVKLKVTASDLRTYGLDKPWLTVAIDRKTDDAVRRNILIGGEAPGGYYATIGATDAVFVLSAATVRVLTTPLVKNL